MKKIILGVVAILSIASVVNAQDNTKYVLTEKKTDFRNTMMIGAKVGANYSNVYDGQGDEFRAKGKLGLATGIFLAIPLGSFLGVQPEVLFSRKGFKATGIILGSTYEFKRTTSYIDVPIYLALKPSNYITLLGGPQYSYLISQKDVFTSGTTSVGQIQEFENDNIRRNTLSLAVGFDVNVQNAVIGARAAWDMTNNNGNGTSTTPRYKNTWLQVTVGFRI